MSDREWVKKYSDTMQPIQKKVCEAIKKNDQDCYVFYAAYKDDKDGCPIDNLNEIAISGKVKFVEQGDTFYGSGESYRSKVLENPTWLDVCVVANEMILTTGDKHHIYLENVVLTEKMLFLENDKIKIARFSMGS